MDIKEIVTRLSNALGWPVVPTYEGGISFARIVNIASNPHYNLIVHSRIIIEKFDANDPKHLDVFMDLLDLRPPITTYIDWPRLITYLEENQVEQPTLEHVEKVRFEG